MDTLVPGIDTTVKSTLEAAEQLKALGEAIDAESLAGITDDTADFGEAASAYYEKVQNYTAGVEQLGQKIAELKEQISLADEADDSQISGAVQTAADTLKSNADTMNGQASVIESWIGSNSSAQVDTSAVDSEVDTVKNNLSAAEYALSDIDYSSMDEGTKAAVHAALGAVQAAKNSAEGIDTSSLKNQQTDTSQ